MSRERENKKNIKNEEKKNHKPRWLTHIPKKKENRWTERKSLLRFSSFFLFIVRLVCLVVANCSPCNKNWNVMAFQVILLYMYICSIYFITNCSRFHYQLTAAAKQKKKTEWFAQSPIKNTSYLNFATKRTHKLYERLKYTSIIKCTHFYLLLLLMCFILAFNRLHIFYFRLESHECACDMVLFCCSMARNKA